MGNYRVTTSGYDVKGKDGRTYFLEITMCEICVYRTTNKRTNKPLLKPVREVIQKYGLHLNTQYENENGCWRNSELERDIYYKGYAYTLENILKCVNEISSDTYTKIEFI